jgi:hypothetical protein
MAGVEVPWELMGSSLESKGKGERGGGAHLGGGCGTAGGVLQEGGL